MRHPTSGARHRWPAALAALVALAALAGLGAASLTVAQANPAPAAPTASSGEDVRTVTYRGYQVDVPAGWRVVDLAEDPDACLRFDRPAVYLGSPQGQQDCPARAAGRTAGLVVEPFAEITAARLTDGAARAAEGSAVAPRAASRGGTIQVAVEDAGLLVTAAHTPRTEETVRQILDGARLTGAARPTAPPSPRGGDDWWDPVLRQAAGPQPGDYLGQGFDACTAPPQSTMDAWLGTSPYQAIGVYISGASRACDQPELTASWVETQTANGWHLIPIDVGAQAPCTDYGQLISTDPATAREQGATAAAESVAAAQALGIPEGSVLYSDIEGYTPGGSCTTAVLNYLSGWTEALHDLGYLAGVYSSGASGISDVAAAYDDPAYTRVDHIWFAWWNGAADIDAGSYVPAEYWAEHQRLHQYAGGHDETYGGVTVNIDSNFLDVGTGTPPAVTCGSVNLDFGAYPDLAAGDGGDEVSAAQCLLAAAGFSPGEGTPTGAFDDATVAAVEAFQADRGLTADGVVGAGTWTALLATGDTPQLANGATGEAVSRLQRALTAALGTALAVDGIFGPDTEQAVRDYQSSRGLDVDGIVGPQTWQALQSGS